MLNLNFDVPCTIFNELNYHIIEEKRIENIQTKLIITFLTFFLLFFTKIFQGTNHCVETTIVNYCQYDNSQRNPYQNETLILGMLEIRLKIGSCKYYSTF